MSTPRAPRPPPSNPCSRCAAALGVSCCEVREGELLATLTDADVARVAEATGLAPKAFAEEDWLTEEQAHAYEERRPLYAGYFRRGPVRLTLRRARGACVLFEKGRGCTLSAQARPTACRVYPFELYPGGELALQVDRFGSVEQARASKDHACLAVEEAASLKHLMRAFELTASELDVLARRLSEEVREHGARKLATLSPSRRWVGSSSS